MHILIDYIHNYIRTSIKDHDNVVVIVVHRILHISHFWLELVNQHWYKVSNRGLVRNLQCPHILLNAIVMINS